MGTIIGSAVLPAALTLLWSGQNWWAATFAPPLGLAFAIIGWLVQTKQEYGVFTVDSTGANNPMLVGNVVALLSPAVLVPLLTYALGPQKYDWQSMREIRRADDHDLADAAHVDLELVPGGRQESDAETAAEQARLTRASRFARILTVALTLAFLVLWPMPLYGTGYIFSRKFFTGWVVVGIVWMFFSSFCVGVYPLWEGRKTIARTTKAVYLDVMGKKKPTPVHGEVVVEDDGTSTPTEKVVPKE